TDAWRRTNLHVSSVSYNSRLSMRSPNWPCQLMSGSSNSPATFANGCIISRFPTRPEEFARPSGWVGDAESSSNRGVPIALAATTTTRAGWKCSWPARSIHVAPVARPFASVSILRTRAPVISVAPRAIAFGQWVRSVDAFAPSLQPDWHVLRWTHARRPSYATELIELNSGHQCHPSLVIPRATFIPAEPIGRGGSGRSSVSGGYAGSPGSPDTPKSRSVR